MQIKIASSNRPVTLFQDASESLNKLKELHPDSLTVKALEKRKRNAKIREYLEKRYYRYKRINESLYKKVGGDIKFLGL